MGLFWADSASVAPSRPVPPSGHPPMNGKPPPACPMHKSSADALSQAAPPPPTPSACPIPHDQRANHPLANLHSSSPSRPSQPDSPPSLLSRINPLNYMFQTISQERAPNQTHHLPTSRDASTIPKGTGDGNWEYPSPQQMYNALLRKGYTDTDITAVESMVAVHNFLNEGAWAEIVEWERTFGGGLSRAWQICKRGEANAAETAWNVDMARRRPGQTQGDVVLQEEEMMNPTLVRFQGRPKDMTPKAAMIQMMGKIYPSMFGTEPPFDRHDWYVSRHANGQKREVRYVIDYYSGDPEPTGEPVFYLDVRPAMTPTGAVERLMKWGGDVWWRASGSEVREQERMTKVS